MNEPRGLELIERYKKNYGISSDACVTEKMILRHWELEKELTQELLSSTPDNRFEVFENCYSRLYSELEWLNQYVKTDISHSAMEQQFRIWFTLIGAPLSQRIYEVGSGKADLISFLARNGYACVATEITRERGRKYSENSVIWNNSDGVHLAKFEQNESYDVVISDQVIEHIHPDDTQDHFRGAHDILRPGGRYIFRVPHKLTGPHDVSKVFKCEKPLGMHLREMTFHEIRSLARSAGFSRLGVVLIGSRKIIIKIFSRDKRISTELYLKILVFVEHIIRFIPRPNNRIKAIRIASRLGFFPDIFVVATK